MSNIPALSVDQMVEVDRLMIEEFHIDLIQMMENAGRNLADCALQLTNEQPDPSFLFICGSGNNGGGGLVAARHLINRGYHVSIVLTRPENSLKVIPAHQWTILKKMDAAPYFKPELRAYNLIIDAIIGYGLKGNPRDEAAHWISVINQSGVPVLALDVPSGLDAANGRPSSHCIQAKATLTLALPKTGLLTKEAKPYVGTLFLADISVPQRLYQSLGITVGPIFHKASLIKV